MLLLLVQSVRVIQNPPRMESSRAAHPVSAGSARPTVMEHSPCHGPPLCALLLANGATWQESAPVQG